MAHDGGEALAVFADRHGVVDRRGVAVHEVEPFAAVEAGGERIVGDPFELVPAHVRQPEVIADLKLAHPAGDQAEAVDGALLGGLEHQLQA